MTFDPSQDFLVFDGLETITYSPIGGGSPFTVDGVLREQLSLREAGAGAQFGVKMTDVPFNIPGPNMGDVTIQDGDRFTDADNVLWNCTQAIAYDILTQQWRVLARQGRV